MHIMTVYQLQQRILVIVQQTVQPIEAKIDIPFY